jgi:hypothetical protein
MRAAEIDRCTQAVYNGACRADAIDDLREGVTCPAEAIERSARRRVREGG